MRIVRYQHPRALTSRTSFLNPWSSFEQEVDTLLNSAFSDFMGAVSAESALGHPLADLYEDKDNFHFRMELPGVKREDIHLELGDGVLTLSGTRASFGKNGEAKTSEKFSRSLSVPARVEESKIAAHYENGVLTVTLPKAEEVKPKRIAIQVK